jgi:RNA polymerase sigma-70 factor (ECF subfamily)
MHFGDAAKRRTEACEQGERVNDSSCELGVKPPKKSGIGDPQALGCPNPAVDAVNDWFSTEVLPLEAALMRFLRRNWRQPDDIPDLRQEIYVRAYESALRDGMPAATPAFLFTCARHLLVDRTRRAKLVSFEMIADLEALPEQPDHDFSPERLAGARDELQLLQLALDDLPPRCREVVMLRKVEGMSQQEIATQLGIAQGTVEKHITLGVRSLAETLYAQGVEVAAAWMRRMRRGESDQ